MSKMAQRKKKEVGSRKDRVNKAVAREAYHEGTQELLDNVTALRQAIPFQEAVRPLPPQAPLQEKSFTADEDAGSQRHDSRSRNEAGNEAGLPTFYMLPFEAMRQIMSLQRQYLNMVMSGWNSVLGMRWPHPENRPHNP
jgi:hypothetical protein